MYKVYFTEKFSLNLENFIISYSSIFEKLFNDTGIGDEFLIVENYRKISFGFKMTILHHIQSQLSEDIVLGRVIHDNNICSLIFRERSFLIIIDYTEDKENKIRYLKNILFTKK